MDAELLPRVATLLFLAAGLGMDAFSVSFAVASGPRTQRQTFRLAFHFGLFQMLMPLAGFGFGRLLVGYIGGIDHWLAFFVMLLIGGHMVLEGLRSEDLRVKADRSRGWSLVGLSVATSIDALGAGMVLGFGEHAEGWQVVFAAGVIGLTAGLMSWLGVRLGRFLTSSFGHRMEVVGGIILIAIGFRLLVTV